jgi:threonine/homoserine/homoserine lactone efflux protein
MNFATWLTVFSVVLLGAMVPGASLAVVLRHTLTGGRGKGCTAALTHGLGVGLYALLCISGLAFLITNSPRLFTAFQWGGALYLTWLGVRGLTARAPVGDPPSAVPATTDAGRDGFLVAFLNPNIAIWFIALFSQVIGPHTTLPARLGYAATAWLTDTAWYLLVAWLLSNPRWLGRLQANTVWLERVFGIILLAFAARLVLQTFH